VRGRKRVFPKNIIKIRAKKQLRQGRKGIHFYDDPLSLPPSDFSEPLCEKNQHIKRIIVKLFIILPSLKPFFHLRLSIDDCCHCADKNKNFLSFFGFFPAFEHSMESSLIHLLSRLWKNGKSLASKGFLNLRILITNEC
jgi:hypothetical protein